MGIFGIVGDERGSVASSVYYGLYALQHRGQQSAGIVVNDDGLFSSHKHSGLVNDVFSRNSLEALGLGKMAIGHVRYGTSKTVDKINAEPIVVNHIKGRLAIATDGKLVNAGGRVLGVTAVADDLDFAIKLAYEKCKLVSFDNAFYRKDIGQKARKALGGI